MTFFNSLVFFSLHAFLISRIFSICAIFVQIHTLPFILRFFYFFSIVFRILLENLSIFLKFLWLLKSISIFCAFFFILHFLFYCIVLKVWMNISAFMNLTSLINHVLFCLSTLRWTKIYEDFNYIYQWWTLSIWRWNRWKVNHWHLIEIIIFRLVNEH